MAAGPPRFSGLDIQFILSEARRAEQLLEPTSSQHHAAGAIDISSDEETADAPLPSASAGVVPMDRDEIARRCPWLLPELQTRAPPGWACRDSGEVRGHMQDAVADPRIEFHIQENITEVFSFVFYELLHHQLGGCTYYVGITEHPLWRWSKPHWMQRSKGCSMLPHDDTYRKMLVVYGDYGDVIGQVEQMLIQYLRSHPQLSRHRCENRSDGGEHAGIFKRMWLYLCLCPGICP